MPGIKPKYKRFTPAARCTACKFSMENKKFHQDILGSTYFDKDSIMSIPQVLKKHKCRIEYRSVMNHVKNHIAPVKRYNDERNKVLEVTKAEVAQEISVPGSGTEHERALDDVIAEFHRNVKAGRIKLTAQAGLQAIKIKADIESKNKDRKLDFLKAFSNMAQNE